MVQHYEITKHFIGGLLKGLDITEITTAKFKVGDVYPKVLGSPYEIVAVKPIPFEPQHDWIWENGVA